MLAKIIRPFTEAATYAGLAAALGTISAQAPHEYAKFLWIATAVCTCLAVVFKG